MTYEECELKAKELRHKDLTAGTENKLIMYLPTRHDFEKYTCLIKYTIMKNHKFAISECECEGDDLSLYFYNPNSKKWSLVDI